MREITAEEAYEREAMKSAMLQKQIKRLIEAGDKLSEEMDDFINIVGPPQDSQTEWEALKKEVKKNNEMTE